MPVYGRLAISNTGRQTGIFMTHVRTLTDYF